MAARPYFAGNHVIAQWALSNYVARLTNTYEGVEQKPRDYFYGLFKGHARLAKLFDQEKQPEARDRHLALAIEAMRIWAEATPTNQTAVFDVLRKIDAAQADQ